MIPMLDEAAAARFWAKVDTSAGSDGCWYVGSQRSTYAIVTIDKKIYSAHRTAYILTYGSIEPRKVLLHRCDNPPCCNPTHLTPGTRGDNNKDAYAKGRGAWSPERIEYRKRRWPR
jgi:hypothetical protein